MNLEQEMDVLCQAVRQAGREVQTLADEGFQTAHKANQSPVTCADLAADRVLKGALLDAFPETGWLSEETRDDLARLQTQRIWIVDPVDGTLEFVEGIPEYAVSVALVDAGRPVLGTVYNPATDTLYAAAIGQGVTRNGELVKASRPPADPPVALASRSEVKRGEWDAFEGLLDVQVCGSIAYKLARVAAGEADMTFSLGPKNEWDIAAGVLLVAEGGGFAGDASGKGFRFNGQARTLVPSIAAATAETSEMMGDLLRNRPTRG